MIEWYILYLFHSFIYLFIIRPSTMYQEGDFSVFKSNNIILIG